MWLLNAYLSYFTARPGRDGFIYGLILFVVLLYSLVVILADGEGGVCLGCRCILPVHRALIVLMWAKNDPPFCVLKITNLLVFFDFEQKKSFWFPTPQGLCGQSGMSAYAVHAVFSHFCYAGLFGDLSCSVVPAAGRGGGD